MSYPIHDYCRPELLNKDISCILVQHYCWILFELIKVNSSKIIKYQSKTALYSQRHREELKVEQDEQIAWEQNMLYILNSILYY